MFAVGRREVVAGLDHQLQEPGRTQNSARHAAVRLEKGRRAFAADRGPIRPPATFQFARTIAANSRKTRYAQVIRFSRSYFSVHIYINKGCLDKIGN